MGDWGFGKSAGEVSDPSNDEVADDVRSYLRAVGSFMNRLATSDDEYVLNEFISGVRSNSNSI